MRPRLLLAGVGETGRELLRLLGATWDVVAIDPDVEALAAAAKESAGLTTHAGDATSAVVLRHAATGAVHAAVACTGSDELNLEFLRLCGRELGIDNRHALAYSTTWLDRYHEEGIDLVSQDRACAAVLASHVQPGQRELSGVGAGPGEIIEVEVLPSSSVAGRRLSELHPHRWLVAAIYRHDQLVVPHGDTVLERGDRVLLVGERSLLPAIATLIRAGESEFPLEYGSHVVVLCGAEAHGLLPEAAHLVATTKADCVELIACEAERAALERAEHACAELETTCESSCVAGATRESLLDGMHRRDVGVLLLPPEPLRWWGRLGLARSRTARVLDQLSSPALVARGTFPYRRLLLLLAELPLEDEAAHVAIALARLLGVGLGLGVVHQPPVVQGPEHRAEMEERRRALERLAGLYHVTVGTKVVEDNPVHGGVGLSREADLLIIPFRRRRTASVIRPDVPLQILHRAACSVLAVPC